MEGSIVHHVIIGNGGAGVSALQAIRSIDDTCDITLISQEQYPAYSPCSLPDLIAGEIDKSTIFRFNKDFYHRLNVTFMKNSEALKINPKEKKVELRDKKQIAFDKLLIAAGAQPITPKGLEGMDCNGVHIMGALDSTLEIITHLKQGVNHVVVIGGGFMGIETATVLSKHGVKVTLVEMLPHVLSRMLDPDISKKVAEILTNHGITLLLNATVKKIIGDKNVQGVSLGKKKIPCDMVILAIGVTPNIGIIQHSGIKCNHGILVDSTMKTNLPNIYAAGDIAEVREQIEGITGSFAIWPNAIEQGRIAGLNMAGKPVSYDGAEVVNVLDVFGTSVVALGRTAFEIGKCKSISRFTPQVSKKILLKNNMIVGLQFVGTIRNTGTFYSLMKKGTDVSSIADRLLDDNFIIAPHIKLEN